MKRPIFEVFSSVGRDIEPESIASVADYLSILNHGSFYPKDQNIALFFSKFSTINIVSVIFFQFFYFLIKHFSANRDVHFF